MTQEDFQEALADEFYTILWAIWSTQFLNHLRDITPRQRGQLRKAMRAYRTADSFNIAFYPSGFYWHLVDGLPEKYRRAARREIPRMVRIAYDLALKRVLPD